MKITGPISVSSLVLGRRIETVQMMSMPESATSVYVKKIFLEGGIVLEFSEGQGFGVEMEVKKEAKP